MILIRTRSRSGVEVKAAFLLAASRDTLLPRSTVSSRRRKKNERPGAKFLDVEPDER